MTKYSVIDYKILPSEDTNDFEVRILLNGNEIIRMYWPDMIGMDPNDLLSFNKIGPKEESYFAIIARCSCGYAGCGSVKVKISLEGNTVMWDSWSGEPYKKTPGIIYFNKNDYSNSLQKAINDTSWESPDRTAARLLTSILNRDLLEQNNFKFDWASGRVRDNKFSVALFLNPGPYQVIVHFDWKNESPEEIAQLAANILQDHPNSWPEVECYGPYDKTSLPSPYNGPGWKI